jgi:Asp-tRNA(Asn)/Glu-tRNA(Gln) amidotransferase A subunit family amidase
MSPTGETTVLTSMSALELAALIRAKKASAREVIEAHLGRIDAVNPTINAITVVLPRRASTSPAAVR